MIDMADYNLDNEITPTYSHKEVGVFGMFI